MFSPLLRPFCSGEKKKSFKLLLIIDNALGAPKCTSAGDTQGYSCILIQHPPLESIEQRLDFQVLHYLRNKSCKLTAAIDSGFSDGSVQSKSKAFWKVFNILDTMKNVPN